MHWSLLVFFLSLGFFPGARTAAQQPIISPRDSASIVLDGKRISINYGRPSMRGRRIVGEFIPYNKVWRTGAGKATSFETEADLRLGDIEIPRGVYSLYTLPTQTQWKLIVNKQTGQWGTLYNPELDFARVRLDQRRLKSPVERLTVSLEKTGNRSGTLLIEWEHSSLWVPFSTLEDAFVASPRDSAELTLQGKRIVVHYGRPFRRGRKIEGGVVPYNEVWRTGANEATILKTETPLLITGYEVPRGTYSLYTLPSSKQWKLIVNKQTGQQGTEYDRALDLVRISVKKETVRTPVEQFTISLEKTGEESGIMKLRWENFSISAPFSIGKAQENGSNSRNR